MKLLFLNINLCTMLKEGPIGSIGRVNAYMRRDKILQNERFNKSKNFFFLIIENNTNLLTLLIVIFHLYSGNIS